MGNQRPGTGAASRAASARPATIDDVARLSGVSRATASRVVNESPRVSPEARIAVQSAVAQLGYEPNRAARTLMTRRSDSIGVVILENSTRLFGDPFFGHLLVGISSGLAASGLQLILLMVQDAGDTGRVERYLAAGHVDGAILVGPHGNDPLPARLARRQLPIVLSGRPLDATRVSYVDVDNRAGAITAIRHLAGQGRRRIATIHGTLDMPSARDRLEGYRDGLREAGLGVDPALEAAGDYSPVIAAQAMRTLLDRTPDLDGVFAASDSMAAAAVGVLLDSGRRVPEDVAVVGFDDSEVARNARPRLTTVRQPIEAMGREMARLILRRVEDPGDVPSEVLFQTELIVRESSVVP
jgi:DNA-binding LacI/PurR family transcriptional regulator